MISFFIKKIDGKFLLEDKIYILSKTSKMVACILPSEPATEVQDEYRPPYDWYSTCNDQEFAGFLTDGDLIDFPKLQRYLWNRTSPIRFGLGSSAFGKYFLYLLFSRCRPRLNDGRRLNDEEIANLCNSLHYMAIWVIVKKFAYTGLVPGVIYNLTARECGELPRDLVVERGFEFFGRITVPVSIETSFLRALRRDYRVAGRCRPRGCVLLLGYKYGSEIGVYHYACDSSEGFLDQLWDCDTDVNPLETAFSALQNAGRVAPELITEEHNPFRDL